VEGRIMELVNERAIRSQQLRYFVAGNTSRTGHGGSDGIENILELWVISKISASGNRGLS